MIIVRTLYDTAGVCQLLSYALGKPVTPADVRNLSRPHAALHKAMAPGGTRGTFLPARVKRLALKMIRRRLAEGLGRVSPRFLDNSHSRICSQCRAVAVEWGGAVACENGHTYLESVDQGKPGGDHTAVASITKDGTVLDIRIFPAGSDDEEILQDLADHG